MRFAPSSIAALFTVTLAFASVNASPLRGEYAPVDETARSMLGMNNNAVSWDSMLLERSPSDPDAAIDLEKRTVYNPPVTYPTKGTVWTAGEKVRVDWTVSEDDPSRKDASIMLGYLPRGHNYNEHLNQTLASNFSLKDGTVSFTLPADIAPRQDYIVVLFGDSGNRSKRFTINAATTAPTKATNNDEEQAYSNKNSKQEDVVVKANSSMLGRDLA